MKQIARRVTLFSAALLMLLATACSVPRAVAPSTKPNATAAKPRALTIGSAEEPDTLNPYVATLNTSFKVMYGVFDPLVNFDKDLNLIPGLAESWSVSSDGLIYTFKLRKGVKWHDGQPFTAADVVATWKVVMDPKFGAFFTSGFDKITAIDTPDDYTAVMKTSEPYAPFLNFVGGALISPKHLIDKGVESFKQEFGRRPIGTGPMKFVQWDSAQQIVLEKNPDYFLGAPKIDKIIFKIVPDTNTLVNQLTTGEIQMTDALGATEYEVVKKLPNSVTQLLTGVNYMHIDLKNVDHLKDKRVRQALDYATPKQQIVDQVLNGLAQVAVADQSPISPFYNPAIQPRPYDLDKAAALLTEAGFAKNSSGIWEKGGAPLKVEYWITSGDHTASVVGQAVTGSWRKLGVDVVERQFDIRNFATASSFFFQKQMTAGQYEWFLFPSEPDDKFFWHSDFIPKEPGGSGGHVTAFFNKLEQQTEFDKLTDAGARELDPTKRKAIYGQIQALLHEEVPTIFLYWDKRIFVAPKNLHYETNGAVPLLFNVSTWTLDM